MNEWMIIMVSCVFVCVDDEWESPVTQLRDLRDLWSRIHALLIIIRSFTYNQF